MKKTYRLLLIFFYVCLVVGTFFIRPVNDDWTSAAYPRFNFSIADLLPSGAFWRPIENTLGGILAYMPILFPYVNHFLVITLFTLSACISCKIMQICRIKETIREIAFFVILLSPAGMATLFSIDAINQAGATLFGLLSIYAYLKNNGWKRYVYWILCTTVAVFFKESGIAYFIATPLFALALSKPDWKYLLSIKKYGAPFIIGILSACVYLFFRIILNNGEISSVDDDSNYAMHFSIVNIIKNAGLLVGSVFSTIDPLALFCPPRNPLIAAITLLAGLPILILTISALIKELRHNENILKYVLLILAIVCVMSPHLLMGHCGEMHAYSILPLCIISVALIFDSVLATGKIYFISLALYFIAAMGIDTHKFTTMYRCSLLGEIYTTQIDKQSTRIPHNVLIIESQNNNIIVYSVFYSSSPKMSFQQGEYYRWRHHYHYPQKIYYEPLNEAPTDIEIEEYIKSYRQNSIDCVWVINDTIVNVIEL